MNERSLKILWYVGLTLFVGGLGGAYIGYKSERIHACRAACKAQGFSQEEWQGFQDYDTCKCWNPTKVTLDP